MADPRPGEDAPAPERPLAERPAEARAARERLVEDRLPSGGTGEERPGNDRAATERAAEDRPGNDDAATECATEERLIASAGARARSGGRRWPPPAQIGLLVAGVLLVVLILRAWPGGALMFGWARAPVTGEQAPAIETRGIDGRPVSLAGLRGRVVLVNFWATWCGPCRKEMPALERLWRERAGQGFTVVGLSQDESATDVVLYVRDVGVTYPIGMATAQQKRAYDVTALPTSYLVDRRGRVRHMVLGAFPDTLLRGLVQRLLAEPPTAR